MTLKEMRESIDSKRRELKRIFAEAGPDMDLSKVKSLSGDVKAKQEHIRDVMAELDGLTEDYRTAKGVDRAIRQSEGMETTLDGAPALWVPETSTGMKTYGKGDLKSFTDSVWSRSELPVRRDELSFGRYVKGLATGDWRGCEAEYKVMTVGSASGGGHLVPEPLSADIIAFAFNKARVVEAGARLVPMESATLKIPSITGLPTAEWLAEDAASSPSDFTVGHVTLTAKKVSITVNMSVELFEDAIGVPEHLEASIGRAIALELDRVALVGASGSGEPVGVVNAASVQAVAHDSTLTSWAPFTEAWGKLEGANFEPNALIMHPRSFADLDDIRTTDGVRAEPNFSYENWRKLASSQVPINLGEGSDTVAFLGEWKHLLWAVRTDARLEMSRCEGDAWSKHQVSLRMYLRGDIGLAYPAAFCKITGIQERNGGE